LLALLGPLAAQGCRRPSEHHHAEHVDPAHRPEDFPSALETLIRQNRRLLEPRSDAVATQDLNPAELLDIARWLPELAADSDMPEAPWSEARALALQLESTYTMIDTTLNEGSSIDEALRDRLQRDLDQMLEFQNTIDPNWFPKPTSHHRSGDAVAKPDDTAALTISATDAGGTEADQ